MSSYPPISGRLVPPRADARTGYDVAQGRSFDIVERATVRVTMCALTSMCAGGHPDLSSVLPPCCACSAARGRSAATLRDRRRASTCRSRPFSRARPHPSRRRVRPPGPRDVRLLARRRRPQPARVRARSARPALARHELVGCARLAHRARGAHRVSRSGGAAHRAPRLPARRLAAAAPDRRGAAVARQRARQVMLGFVRRHAVESSARWSAAPRAPGQPCGAGRRDCRVARTAAGPSEGSEY